MFQFLSVKRTRRQVLSCSELYSLYSLAYLLQGLISGELTNSSAGIAAGRFSE
jgi:hypothetical protein